MPVQIGDRCGEYQLLQLLGAGGFAEVYLGRNVHLPQQQVAIKILKKEQLVTKIPQFQNEASIILGFNHPNIIHFLSYAIYSNLGNTNTLYPYLVMEYAPLGSLRKNHPRNVPLPLPLIASYTNQIAGALQYAHDRQVMHLDVKPENVLIGNQGQLLLSDFGLATVVTEQEKKNDVQGTLIYMAPEQIDGNPKLASDQYALGIVIYEWICGHVPFTGRTIDEVIDKHFFELPASLLKEVPTLPPEVEVVVMRALAKKAEDRYPSINEFAQALEGAINQGNNMGGGTNNAFDPAGLGANDPFGSRGMGGGAKNPFDPGGIGANNPPPFPQIGPASPFFDDPPPYTPGGSEDLHGAPTLRAPGFLPFMQQRPWNGGFANTPTSAAPENSISQLVQQTLGIQSRTRRRRYNSWVIAGIVANVIGAIFFGFWFADQLPTYANDAGWWTFIFSSLISAGLSWLFFASNRRMLQWALAAILSFYWGLVGNAFAMLIGAGTRINFLPDGSIMFVLFLVAGFVLHAWILTRHRV